MTKFFANFLRDESGASAAEYVILIAVLGGAVAGGALAFGGSLKAAMTTKGAYLTTCANSADGTAC
ncbi:Flp family type IVb pilin [Novosphingobium sp. KCTC 2891]|uniref:Flp family type IVb pilin n=1 Tax=Novosphingobium sp. KCTC 2891 TaxID=2989730 RepID=UPI0022230BC7|nr:Flp family type IVb pilin [Novosphingobium sp. KCTC 2891]MCW1381594.1 Flp family type IVb pilin [Novosphingobium sp. KCTC 2891]